MNHSDLCTLAVKWLKRPNSAGGHGCTVAVSECRSGHSGETPDAIGFRANWNNGSVVVEAKVSRSDFLADRAKPHRQPGAGMGTWRYYMTPEGLLKPEDLPEKWGLLEVNKRGHVKPVVGPAVVAKNWGQFSEAREAFRHEVDHDAERDLLVLLIARIEDPQAVSQRIREANNATQRLIREFERERARHREAQDRMWSLRNRIRELEARLGDVEDETHG